MTEPDDDTARLLADAAQDFLRNAHDRERLRAVFEKRSTVDRGFWRQMAEQGWLALRLPEAQGGSGLALAHAAVITEALGRHAVPEPFIACAMMPAALMAALPPSPAWAPLHRGLIDGRHVSTVAWQAHPQAMDADEPGIVAEPAPGGVRLTGRAFGVVGAPMADSVLVSALHEGRPSLWRMPRGTEGAVWQDVLACDGGTVSVLDVDMLLPADTLLAQGPRVAAALQQALDEATLLAACQLVGTGSAALALTLDYLRTRQQFGRTIGSFQSLQHLAADVRIQLALAQAACMAALQRQPGPAREGDARADAQARAAIAAAKARACDAALQAGRFGIQAHGAIGFAAEGDAGLFLKSAMRLSAWLGSAPQQRRRHGVLTGLHED
ncbi:acyl-CoA dehydrogenase family protein [Aquincola sp. MAHUQ-54]|uniref:Acyl-CoA dehydrogenase family protein n=1 Tax=Aquincola agrisoli TaxID=3119538 RepID=A0AAW9QR64_9BURK